ncbi:hypothetical protein [Sporomusa sp.]|uniref:beta strand repeat-containing protein n=1 Tax=Sporomusa sp. TaxID=2078658 RepID=UPI002CA8DF5F|nr:hypothetical protein [Sporomusa sp.]HWR42553.1 hypothetical protein [Sporomusa sp.]
MAYNNALPANDGFIADAPTEIRANTEGLRTGQIVDAGTLKGLSPGNVNGSIPINNGTVNTNLNAQYHGGNLPSAYATAGHTHTAVTTSANGLMINTDKGKLDGIAAGAEINQLAFSNVLVGSTTIAADSKTDTLTMTAGAGITLTPDAANDAVTIAVTQDGHSHAVATTSSAGFESAADKIKLDGIAAGAEVNQNAFSTIVAGGVSAVADNKTDTFTINAGAGITVTGDAANDACTIAVTANGHTHTDATTGAAGFMPAAMVTKLNGIAAGAEVNQNAFSNILVGSTTVAADAESDTLELVAGINITLTPDATNDRITIANTYVHPTGDGNSHVPATGTANNTKVLKAGATVNSAAWGQVVASEVANTPAGNIASTTVQAAINELDAEKVNTSDVVTTATANKILKLDATSKLPTSITGNAASATMLATARNINGAAFDGSSDIVIPTGFKNYIINGKFDIWQRGTSFSLNVYTADRWQSWMGIGGSVTVSKGNMGSTGDLFDSYLSFNQTVGATSNQPVLLQKIENVKTLAGKTVTLSFYASCASGTLNVTPHLIQFFGTGGSATVAIVGETKVIQSGSFQKYSVTFNVPSIIGKTIGANNYLQCDFGFPLNTVFTFSVAQVQLEEGAVATPFEQRHIQQEIALCQRYYEIGWGIAAINIVNFLPFHNYKVSKRVIPTLSILGLDSGGTGLTIMPATINQFYQSGIHSIASGFMWSADAEL